MPFFRVAKNPITRSADGVLMLIPQVIKETSFRVKQSFAHIASPVGHIDFFLQVEEEMTQARCLLPVPQGAKSRFHAAEQKGQSLEFNFAPQTCHIQVGLIICMTVLG